MGSSCPAGLGAVWRVGSLCCPLKAEQAGVLIQTHGWRCPPRTFQKMELLGWPPGFSLAHKNPARSVPQVWDTLHPKSTRKGRLPPLKRPAPLGCPDLHAQPQPHFEPGPLRHRARLGSPGKVRPVVPLLRLVWSLRPQHWTPWAALRPAFTAPASPSPRTDKAVRGPGHTRRPATEQTGKLSLRASKCT